MFGEGVGATTAGATAGLGVGNAGDVLRQPENVIRAVIIDRAMHGENRMTENELNMRPGKDREQNPAGDYTQQSKKNYDTNAKKGKFFSIPFRS